MTMDLGVLFLGLIYLVAGIATMWFLKKSGMTLAAMVYAVAFAVLALYIPVAAGCNLMVRLVQLFADSSTATYFAEFINEPLGMLNSYVTVSYVAALALSLFVTFSTVFLAIKVVGVVRRFFCREPATFSGRGKRKTESFAKRSLYTSVPFRYVFCRYNC